MGEWFRGGGFGVSSGVRGSGVESLGSGEVTGSKSAARVEVCSEFRFGSIGFFLLSFCCFVALKVLDEDLASGRWRTLPFSSQERGGTRTMRLFFRGDDSSPSSSSSSLRPRLVYMIGEGEARVERLMRCALTLRTARRGEERDFSYARNSVRREGRVLAEEKMESWVSKLIEFSGGL